MKQISLQCTKKILNLKEWEDINAKLHGLQAGILRGTLPFSLPKLKAIKAMLQDKEKIIKMQGGDASQWISIHLPELMRSGRSWYVWCKI